MRVTNSIVCAVLAALLIFCFLGCFKKDEQNKEEGRPKAAAGDLNAQIDSAVTKGAEYLISKMNEQGVIMIEYEGKAIPNAGITALAVVALIRIDSKTDQVKEAIKKGTEFLVSLKKEDGGIYLSPKAAPPTYVTAVAILALNRVDSEKYKDIIKGAQDYLAGKQAKKKDDKTNDGGIGYGSDKTANLSTTQFALEALRESGYKNEEVFQRAIEFIQRCQNNSETNDLPAAGNDGGLYYNTHSSKAGEITLENGNKGYKSYGSMTYAGIKSYIYAGLDKKDSRVLSALKWIKDNYTVDANPGMGNPNMGLYYYFHTMAKTLAVLEIDMFEDSAGRKHDWRKDLGEKIMSLQNKDGSWINSEDRWFESIKPLATAYAMIALEYCRK